ncbi:hypothetical protein A6A06_30065 [Streptomyces sp. CB02923]|uniref:DUF6314 family protein n=1 Tax=Streptomyces sp. CB02923 TaxID=1718985 RepID=UPI00093BBA29|nr:DUF6314 family protein [Streptomyces sp. CB02923]OKH98420.1 hypothetical protein A6A06_30065 [Streptomyces sp. CB02923]
MPTEPDAATVPGAPYAVADAAEYLAGWWTIDRTVLDVRTGTQGTFRGTAHFRPEGPEESDALKDSESSGGGAASGAVLLHVEEGELTWNGTTAPAARTLRLCPHPDGTADVTFADGRPFHDLDLRTGHWTTRHPCAADLYDGEFTVVSPGEWHLRWQVGGPAKAQLLCSVYRRTVRPLP